MSIVPTSRLRPFRVGRDFGRRSDHNRLVREGSQCDPRRRLGSLFGEGAGDGHVPVVRGLRIDTSRSGNLVSRVLSVPVWTLGCGTFCRRRNRGRRGERCLSHCPGVTPHGCRPRRDPPTPDTGTDLYRGRVHETMTLEAHGPPALPPDLVCRAPAPRVSRVSFSFATTVGPSSLPLGRPFPGQ